jgi:putative FmdB family regulatory protein
VELIACSAPPSAVKLRAVHHIPALLGMPTHDYRCPAGHDFEHFFRKISDATGELPCPECGAVAARRVSGGAGLVFKGSGFYLTDYGKNAHRKGSEAPSSESKGDASGESKGDASSESKPAAKESSKTEGASGAAKSESASSATSEPSKSSETKPSPKPKGGESK